MKRRIVFLIGARYRDKGSSILRGYQLSQICRIAFGSNDVSVEVSDSIDGYENAFLILTKSFLWNATVEIILNARRRENRVCCDFLDDPVNADIASVSDTLMASSLTQYKFMVRNFPSVRVVYVGH